MCKTIRFFSSLDDAKNGRAKSAIMKIPGVKVEWIAASEFLDEIEELPFIHTDEGDRFFGVDDIEYFVEDELRAEA